MKKILLCILCFVVTFTMFGCGQAEYAAPEASADEIVLQIKMDVKEDFGLLLVDYDMGGDGGSGGVSNANKTLLQHDETLDYTLEKTSFENPSDANELTLQFTIVTEYFTPNYENSYPQEAMVPIPAITLQAKFGETYFITISGDKTNGYTAVLGS